MHITSLKLRHFRNIAQLNLSFSSQVTTIIAPNGTGKTNVIEAISFLSRGKTDRGERESDLFSWNQPRPRFSRIEGIISADTLEDVSIQVTLKEGLHRAEKTMLVNDVKKKSNELAQIFPALFFSPDTLGVIAGSPSRRREFFDHVLPLFNQRYRSALQQYTKALQQRNRILQDPQGRIETLAPWDEQVARYGACVMMLRRDLTNQCREHLADISQYLHTAKDQQVITYRSSIATENVSDEEELKQKILKSLDSSRVRDRASGITNVGPHRDDWDFFLGAMNLKTFGSRGQQRMGSIALLMSTFLLLCRVLGTKPVLLLDDLFSELDSDHSEKLFQFLAKQCGQCIITTTDLALTHPKLAEATEILSLKLPHL